MSSPNERTEQKQRTREAILAGAKALIERGEVVSVAAAGAEVGISKATAYRYFSDPAVLMLEAGLAVRVADYEEVIRGARTVRERVHAVSRYILVLTQENEIGFRQFLAAALTAWVNQAGKGAVFRGGRRIPMFEKALAEVRDELGEKRFRELVLALTMATGSEAHIALADIARVDNETARATVANTVDALLDKYLGPNGDR